MAWGPPLWGAASALMGCPEDGTGRQAGAAMGRDAGQSLQGHVLLHNCSGLGFRNVQEAAWTPGRNGCVMKRRMILCLACALALVWAAEALAGGECMSGYFRTRDRSCPEAVLEAVRPSPKAQPGQETATLQPVVGFLAEVFRADAQERQRLLAKSLSPLAQSLCVEALWRAGLREEARRHAQAKGGEEAFRRCSAQDLAPIDRVRPLANPGDNDLLIGAFMASGRTQHLRNILENFTGASSGMAADALRMGMLLGRSGAGGRKPNTAQAACAKYSCQQDRQPFMRVMTLASASWALQSLGQREALVQQVWTEFFGQDQRLKQVLASEQGLFGNYLTLAATQSALKSEPSLEAYLSGYESLKPGKDLEAVLLSSPMFKKKAP